MLTFPPGSELLRQVSSPPSLSLLPLSPPSPPSLLSLSLSLLPLSHQFAALCVFRARGVNTRACPNHQDGSSCAERALCEGGGRREGEETPHRTPRKRAHNESAVRCVFQTPCWKMNVLYAHGDVRSAKTQ